MASPQPNPMFCAMCPNPALCAASVELRREAGEIVVCFQCPLLQEQGRCRVEPQVDELVCVG